MEQALGTVQWCLQGLWEDGVRVGVILALLSIGIARIAIQNAQVCFFSYATKENNILNMAGCLQSTLFSACVKLGSKESLPCCGVTLY